MSVNELIRVFYESTQKLPDYKKLWEGLQNYHSCRQSWFKRENLTVRTAVLVYYNIDPDACTDLSDQLFKDLILPIDFENEICRNLEDYCLVHCSNYMYGITLSMLDFKHFLVEKEYALPSHFPPNWSSESTKNSLIIKRDERNKKSENTEHEIAVDDSDSFDNQEPGIKKTILVYDLKKFSLKQLGILQARIHAAVAWKNKPNLSQKEIVSACESQMRDFYKYAQMKDAKTKEINQEWIGDMDPRQAKRGRKKKIISEIENC